MSKVLTFSRVFPAYHPRKGQPTFFVEKITRGLLTNEDDSWYNLWKSHLENYYQKIDIYSDYYVIREIDSPAHYSFSPKHHTIRAGNRWKVGDKFSPRIWSGKPYNSPQITIAPDIEIKKVWDFEIESEGDYLCVLIDGKAFYEANFRFKVQPDAFETLAKNDGLNLDDFNNWFQFPKPFRGQIICWSDSIEY